MMRPSFVCLLVFNMVAAIATVPFLLAGSLIIYPQCQEQQVLTGLKRRERRVRMR